MEKPGMPEDCRDCGRAEGCRAGEWLEREGLARERVDAQGRRWTKAYCGGGGHFENWLAQCREIGEVEVEEIDASMLACYRESGEKLLCIWIKIPG
jgi:hypothetical protein